MQIVAADNGRCEMTSTVPAALINAAGFAHGSIAFSLLDTACAYAIGSRGVRGVTSNANLTYVRAATPGATLTGTVEIASQSQRVASLRGEVVNSDGALIAHGTFVFQLIQVRD